MTRQRAEVTDAITDLASAIAALTAEVDHIGYAARWLHELELVSEMLANIDNYVRMQRRRDWQDKLADCAGTRWMNAQASQA